MTPNDVVKFIRDILNIDLNNSLVMDDILIDLKEIHDLNLFRIFIKQNFNKERYKYQNGYQKFITLSEDFKNANKPTLNELESTKVNSFSLSLYKKTCDVFDEVNWHIQNGKSIDDFKMEKSFIEKELRVLNAIGDKSFILNFVKTNKYGLEQKIKNIVMNFTMKKFDNTKQIENVDSKVIKMLKGGR